MSFYDLPFFSSNNVSTKTPTQEKPIKITQNGTIEVFPDAGYALSKVVVDTSVIDDRLSDMIQGNGDIPYDAITGDYIRPYAFAYMGQIDQPIELAIPDTVTSISEYAFSHSGISSVTIPDTVEYIGEYAFESTPITSIKFPTELNELNQGICSYCQSLTSVELPPHVTSLPSDIFYNCSAIETIELPENLTTIDSSAFASSGISSIKIPEGVTRIDSNAFGGCDNLKELSLPSNLSYIGSNAFSYSALERIVIPDSVSNIFYGTFYSCENLAEVTLPKNLKTIEGDAFYNNTSLNNIIIPEGVTDINYNAFYECTNLTDVVIPESVNYIDYSAFSECPNLTIHSFEGSYADTYASDCGISVSHLTVSSISLGSLPNRTTYPIDGTLNTKGLSLTIITDEGYTIPVTTGYTVGEYDFSTEGTKTITITYKDRELSFEVYVDPTLIIYPESDHPYNSYTESWTYTHKTDANYLAVTFSSETYTEDGCDYIELYDAYGSFVDSYSGSELAGKTVYIPGNSFLIQISSDGSVEEYGFSITNIEAIDEIPREVTYICISTQPDKVKYNLGEEIDLTGLSLYVQYNDNTSEQVYEGYTVSGYDSSITGYQYITISYGNYSVSLQIKVIDPNVPQLPESDHPYLDNTDETWYYTHPTEAEYLAITFSSNTYTEQNYDFIKIYLADNTLFREYSGSKLSGRTVTIPGSSFSIQLTSDGSSNHYGFEITNIEAVDEMPPVTCEELYISRYPNKTVYLIGEEFELTGLEIRATMSDGTYEYITEGYTIADTDYDSSNAGNYTVQIYYKDRTTNISISVEEPYQNFTIEDGALTGYSGNTSEVVIPDGVVTITSQAFDYYDNSITSIVIPDSVSNIDDYAFYSCQNLTSISFGANSNNIKNVTSHCDNLSYIRVSDDNTAYTDINGVLFNKDGTILMQYPTGRTDTDYVMPEGVIKIQDSAFDSSKVINVTIQDGLVEIGPRAFAYCYPLTSVNIPQSVESIGEFAFGHSNVNNIVIPDKVTELAGYVFMQCYGLTDIYIGDRVSKIDSETFRWCDNITNIKVSESNEYYKDVDGILFTKDGSTLVKYTGGKDITSYTVPTGVTAIADLAFDRSRKLTEVIIPEGVIEIGHSVFSDCTSLETVVIPEGVLELKQSLFSGCSSLINVSLPSTLINIESNVFPYEFKHNLIAENGLYYIDNYLVGYDFNYSESYVIKDGTTLIAGGAFESCSQPITSLPDTLITISDEAFKNAYGITEVVIPDSVTSIGKRAFYWCKQLTSVTLGSGLTTIPDEAFCADTALTKVNIPTNITYIADDAFGGCENIINIDVSEDNKSYKDIDGVLFTKDGTKLIKYTTGSAASTYEVPDGVIVINSGAFSGAEFTSITIPNSVLDIGSYTFSGCTKLTEVKLPYGLTCLNEGTFSGCDKLTELIIPESVTTLEYSFSGAGLTGLIIPQSVTQIKGYPLLGDCEDLATLTIPSTVEIEDKLFYSTPSALESIIIVGDTLPLYEASCVIPNDFMDYNAIIYIKTVSDSVDLGNLVEQYKAHPYWIAYADRIKPSTAYEVVELSVTSLPNKTLYAVNERIYTDGLILSAVDATGGQTEVLNGYKVENYDFSSEGTKIVTVSYHNAITQFEVEVSSEVMAWPESEHPYENNKSYDWIYTHYTDANYLAITFSTKSYAGYYSDAIKVYDKDNNLCASCDGWNNYYGIAGKTFYIPGNLFSITLTSDSDSPAYGFSFTNIEAVDEIPY